MPTVSSKRDLHGDVEGENEESDNERSVSEAKGNGVNPEAQEEVLTPTQMTHVLLRMHKANETTAEKMNVLETRVNSLLSALEKAQKEAQASQSGIGVTEMNVTDAEKNQIVQQLQTNDPALQGNQTTGLILGLLNSPIGQMLAQQFLNRGKVNMAAVSEQMMFRGLIENQMFSSMLMKGMARKMLGQGLLGDDDLKLFDISSKLGTPQVQQPQQEQESNTTSHH